MTVEGVRFPDPSRHRFVRQRIYKAPDSHLQGSLGAHVRQSQSNSNTYLRAFSQFSRSAREASVHFSEEPKLSPGLMFRDFQ